MLHLPKRPEEPKIKFDELGKDLVLLRSRFSIAPKEGSGIGVTARPNLQLTATNYSSCDQPPKHLPA